MAIACAAAPASPTAFAAVAGDRAGGPAIDAASDVDVNAATDTGLALYLAVTLNGVQLETLSAFVLRAGVLYADAADLRTLGLRWPGSESAAGLLRLDSLPGLVQHYDGTRQRLVLTAPLDLLDRPVLRADMGPTVRPRVDADTLVPGLLFNYDLYALRSSGQRSLSAVSELRVFGAGPGVYSQTQASSARSASGEDGEGGAVHRNVRLDSSWPRDFPEQPATLVLGDTSTAALPWSRALRIGGLRLSSNFALQPYRVTAPLALFEGSAVLPSTVDLFIDGVRQSSRQVPPGRFQMAAVPSLNGLGQARLLITDLNGQARSIDIDLYGEPQLLQAGLSEGSLEFGLVRRDYGLRSFAYTRDPVLSATVRHGLTAGLTLEAHAEAAAGLAQGGAGAIWLLPREAGVFSAALAASRHAGLSGMQRSLGYQWNSRAFNLSLQSLRADVGYRDAASLGGAAVLRLADSLFAGVNSDWGQLGLGLARQSATGAAISRVASLSWSRQLGRDASLGLSLTRNFGDSSGPVLYLSWSMALERRMALSASGSASRGAHSLAVAASRSARPGEDEPGWQLQGGLGEKRNALAELSGGGRYGDWSVGIGRSGGRGMEVQHTQYASASGALVLMQGALRGLRRVDDAFALVSTSGIAGVPVRLENRLVGHTDERGLLFVTQLNAYQDNRLSIDTAGLPADLRIERELLTAVPPSRGGMLALFGLQPVLALQLSLRDAHGAALAAGSPVRLEPGGAAPLTVVGYDGLVYLESPAPGSVLRVTGEAGECRVVLPPALPPGGIADLGVLTCR